MDAHTQLAIETFWKLVKTEARAEILEKQLNGYVRRIPKDEMEFYVEATTEEVK